MKNFFRVIVFLVIGLLFVACGPSVTATPSPIPSPTTTAIATFTPIPGPTVTAAIEPTSRPEFVPPTLIPTIDPGLVPELLRKAFSVQTLEGVNGHNIRQITGWDYGFGRGLRTASCAGYYWLDERYLLLYPAAGEVSGSQGTWVGINVVPQSVIINLESGATWLPPVNTSRPRCNWVDWSRELRILITSEIHNDVSTVSTYMYDGYKLASYPGSVLSVSPSRTKILIADDTLIDLRTNEKINLNWSLEGYQEQILSGLFWTSDETRIYRCCYFYADLNSGTSFRYGRSDFLDRNGNQINYEGLWLQRGFWVLNDKYFLVWWQAVDDGDIKYLPMLDPAKRILYDVREMAGIPEEFTSLYTPVSPDGNYVWMEGWKESYLVNLTTFETQHYTYSNPYSYTDIDWSSDSKFSWFEIYDSDAKTTEFNILSISDMKLHPLSIVPPVESIHWWHPTENTVVYSDRDGKSLIFLDVSTMSYRELSFPLEEPPYTHDDVVWKPNGEKLALVKEDGSVWQVDYPTLENLEQLTPSLSDVSSLNWSPDGNSISFIGGSDIYIVETDH
jgi:WD40 repeat protein